MSNLNQGSLDAQMQLLKVEKILFNDTTLLKLFGTQIYARNKDDNAFVDIVGKDLWGTNGIIAKTISEFGGGNGVTIDGVLLKDGAIPLSNTDITGVNKIGIVDPTSVNNLSEGVVFVTTSDGNLRLSPIDNTSLVNLTISSNSEYDLKLDNLGTGKFQYQTTDKYKAQKTLTATDPSSTTTSNSTIYAPSSGGEQVLAKAVENIACEFTLPALSGTQSLSLDTITVNFQTQVDGTNWLTRSTAFILAGGYGAWTSSTISSYGNGGNPVKWRLEINESASNGEAYNIASFLPTVTPFIDMS